MKTEHRTLQNLLRLVRIVSSKKSMFSREKETAAPLLWYHTRSISDVPTDFLLWIREAVDFPLGIRIKHHSKSKKRTKILA